MLDDILKKLLESDLLNEDTKAELATQFNTAVTGYLAEERSKLEIEVRSALTEEFVKAREELAESIYKKIDDAMAAEAAELREDINNFRDLEVESAEMIAEEKERLAQRFGEEIDQLVKNLDNFLEVRLDEEISEFKSDLEDVKKLEFGRKIFEAFEQEFRVHRKSDMVKIEQDLGEALDKLTDAEKRLEEIESSRLAEARTAKMDELLSPLGGNAREQMKIILSNVATEKLDEAYKIYIGRVLKESVVVKKEEKTVVNESKVVPLNKVVTGNETKEELTEEVTPPAADQSIARWKKLAGLK
jgi:hypothetical protein